MVNRWRALPPPTRMWVMSGVVWLPLILLELILEILFGGTSAWTPILVSLIVIGVVISGAFWVLGAMRAVRLLRAGRQQSTSGPSRGPGLP